MVPWPTSQSTTPEWDPAHGIGDWEARLAALHAADDAEAESSEEDDEDSVSDDAEDFEEQFAEGAAGGCQWCKVKDAEHDCPHCGEGGFGLMAECSCPDGFTAVARKKAMTTKSALVVRAYSVGSTAPSSELGSASGDRSRASTVQKSMCVVRPVSSSPES